MSTLDYYTAFVILIKRAMQSLPPVYVHVIYVISYTV